MGFVRGSFGERLGVLLCVVPMNALLMVLYCANGAVLIDSVLPEANKFSTPFAAILRNWSTSDQLLRHSEQPDGDLTDLERHRSPDNGFVASRRSAASPNVYSSLAMFVWGNTPSAKAQSSIMSIMSIRHADQSGPIKRGRWQRGRFRLTAFRTRVAPIGTTTPTMTHVAASRLAKPFSSAERPLCERNIAVRSDMFLALRCGPCSPSHLKTAR